MTDSDLKIYLVRFLAAVDDVDEIRMHQEKVMILQYTMTIDFMEAVFGKETEIEIPKEETCDTCKGSGAKKGTSAKTCTHCDGAGEINVTQDTPLGRMVNVELVIIVREQGKLFLRNVQHVVVMEQLRK